MSAELPKPNIKTDKLLVIMGGSLFPITRPMTFTCPIAPAWITAIPEGELTEEEAKSYPTERYFRVMHETQVGTVDELVELFREKLTRAYHAFALTPEDGEKQPVIPMFGEPSLRKQNDALASQFGPAATEPKASSVIAKATPKQYAAYLAVRKTTHGEPDTQQDAMTADELKRFVAVWLGRQFPTNSDSEIGDALRKKHDNGNSMPLGPTDDPKAVQSLIDALIVLKQDSEARRARSEASLEAKA